MTVLCKNSQNFNRLKTALTRTKIYFNYIKLNLLNYIKLNLLYKIYLFIIL